jgi:Zn-dependent alcohol dehydrogenase
VQDSGSQERRDGTPFRWSAGYADDVQYGAQISQRNPDSAVVESANSVAVLAEHECTRLRDHTGLQQCVLLGCVIHEGAGPVKYLV